MKEKNGMGRRENEKRRNRQGHAKAEEGDEGRSECVGAEVKERQKKTKEGGVESERAKRR